jgi:hypothetical protein
MFVKPAIIVGQSPPCSLCRVAKHSGCPRCRGTGHTPANAGLSDSFTVDDFVQAIRRASPVPVYVTTGRTIYEGLLRDRTADIALGVAGVRRVDAWGDWADRFARLYDAALAHINRTRVTVQRPLDPGAAEWTRDDVFIEAYRLGWKP